jgi:hypothetical protein
MIAAGTQPGDTMSELERPSTFAREQRYPTMSGRN